MVAPKPLAARRRTNSSSPSVTVPSSWEESVVSGAITNRFAISRPQLNRNGDQTTIHKTPNIPQIERQFTFYVRVWVALTLFSSTVVSCARRGLLLHAQDLQRRNYRVNGK